MQGNPSEVFTPAHALEVPLRPPPLAEARPRQCLPGLSRPCILHTCLAVLRTGLSPIQTLGSLRLRIQNYDELCVYSLWNGSEYSVACIAPLPQMLPNFPFS